MKKETGILEKEILKKDKNTLSVNEYSKQKISEDIEKLLKMSNKVKSELDNHEKTKKEKQLILENNEKKLKILQELQKQIY